MKNVYNMIN